MRSYRMEEVTIALLDAMVTVYEGEFKQSEIVDAAIHHLGLKILKPEELKAIKDQFQKRTLL